MKNVDKVHINYKVKALDIAAFEPLRNADEEDLRVLLAAMLFEKNRENGEIDTAILCESLEISEAELFASLKYWRGAGFISISKKKSTDSSSDKKEKSKHESAHKDGKLEKDRMPSYTTEELTQLMEKRKITSDFIGEASRVYGKIFNQHEVEMIVRMIDYIGFDSESVLLLLSYYSKQKKTLRYIEKMALKFYDEGISSPTSLQEKLCAMERREQIEGKIRAMFGMTNRELTTKEKGYITSWVEKMKFDLEMIRLAYDTTVDITHEPSPAYANGILERWFADGIDTPEKVKAAKQKREESNAAKVGKVERSFDSNDFFEAALRRSYEDN